MIDSATRVYPLIRGQHRKARGTLRMTKKLNDVAFNRIALIIPNASVSKRLVKSK
jgi:hypothetical protein